MAKSSVIYEGLSGILGDLAKIAMSNQMNSQSNQLTLEKELISLELTAVAKDLSLAEAEYKKKQEEYKLNTGLGFKVSDESKTAGYEKFVTSVSTPLLEGHIDTINNKKQELATKRYQIASLDKILQGPIADMKSFYTGAADPAYFGDPNILESGDMSADALKAFLGDKYQDVDASVIAGAQAKIKAQTALQQMQIIQASDELSTTLIVNQNRKSKAIAEAPFVDVTANLNNIKIGKRTLSSLIDTDILLNQMSDVSQVEGIKDLHLASSIDPDVTGTKKTLADNKLSESQAALDGEFYMIGSALLAEDEVSLEEYIELNGEEAAADLIEHGKEYYNAVKSAVPTKARPEGTKIPVVNILVESNMQLIDENTGDYIKGINWDRIEDITGYTEEMWKRNIPLMQDTQDAIRLAEAANAKQATIGFGDTVSEVDEPETVDPENDETYTSGVLDPGLNQNYLQALNSLEGISYYSPFEEKTELDPFEPYSAELDFSYTETAREEDIEDYYKLSAPKEYNALRARIHKKEELLSIIEDATRIRDGISPTSSDRDSITARIGAERMRKEAQSEYNSIERGEDLGAITGMNLESDLDRQIIVKEKQNKDVSSFSRTWSNGDRLHLNNLMKELGVESDTALYSIPQDELVEAIAKLEGYYNSEEQNTSQGNSKINPSQRNNNPGNLKYAGQKGAIGIDDDGFAIFANAEDGFQALRNQIKLNQLRSHKYWSDTNLDRRESKALSDKDFMDQVAKLFPSTL